ncbi:nucleoside triphosphate pyrophosphohydrolase [Vibrio salinus]|uniref:nucleoside triphosphate pyrophosphohydrolase n=1 Tax=Vibrio salinus TaxID=2899784 RepID=UPI001E36CB0E|nr:nucleoside triphosphate pyrophosphohydrolase [Vibrio salinus]MCE0493409.1 nucleoside triphosphate pyrophosphohydrolase [Vibrio salinus]
MTSPIDELQKIMTQLRDPENGCPWDKKQSFDSIIPCTIEETYEVVDAIHNRDWDNLREELGDFVFQAIFYSQLAKEQELFDFNDVISDLNEKLIRRHPHVFSDQVFESDEAIRANWDKVKQQEKAAKPLSQNDSIFDSLPGSLPALGKAVKIQKKCAKYGFDWESVGPVVDKVREEIGEVMEEADRVPVEQSKLEEEVGDLLFAVVNLSRHLKCDPETALQKANLKFMRRFRGIESIVGQQEKSLEEYSLDELENFWQQVKNTEKNEQ